MIHYLSDIASRSSSEGIPAILPPGPGPSFPGVGLTGDHTGEVDQGDNSGPEEGSRQDFSPPSQVQHADGNQTRKAVRRDPANKEMYPVPSYFSRYIERVETMRESKEEVRQQEPVVTVLKEETSQQQAGEIRPLNSDDGERTVPGEKEPVILPLQKGTEERKDETSSNRPQKETTDDDRGLKNNPILQPSIEDKSKGAIDRPPEISPIQILIPDRPFIENKAPEKEKIRKEEPRLVIGKITVEIVPPAVPLPQKTITKVIQAPTGGQSIKSNKLSFGLGQL